MTASDDQMKRILTWFAPVCIVMMCVINYTDINDLSKAYFLTMVVLFTMISARFSLSAIRYAVLGPENESYGTSIGYMILSALSIFPLRMAKDSFESEVFHYIVNAGIIIISVLGVMHFLHCVIAFASTGDTEPFWKFWTELGSELSAAADQYKERKRKRSNKEQHERSLFSYQ